MSKKKKSNNIIDGIKIPNKIKCTICHKFFGVRTDVLLKRMEVFSGTTKERLNALQGSYVCRTCRKINQVDGTGETVSSISGTSTFDYSNAFWRQPGYQFPSGNVSHPIDVSSVTLNTCLIPNLILKKMCRNCMYFSQCNFKKKSVSKTNNRRKN